MSSQVIEDLINELRQKEERIRRTRQLLENKLRRRKWKEWSEHKNPV